MSKLIDLTGKRFGRLIVIKQADSRVSSSGHFIVRWECKCDCGNTVVVDGSHLRNGDTQSCGCLNKEIVSNLKTKDLSNMDFGYLHVLHRSNKHCRCAFWTCQCKCGNIVDIAGSALTSGNTKSCGCFKIEKLVERSRKENKITIYDSYATIELQTGRLAIIDIDKVDLISKYCWTENSVGYAITYLPNTKNCVLLHQLIMNTINTNIIVDHKNLNKLDNRVANLRIATHKDNNTNTGLSKRNHSGFKGVCWSKKYAHFIAQISNNGKHYYLGSYINPEDAARAYDLKARELFGEFAWLNFP